MRSVGIDVGSHSIKVCILDQSSKGIQLLDYFEKAIISQNKFDRDLEVIEYLRDQLPKFDPTQIKIVWGLRQDRVSLRFKGFPFKDRSKILKSLPFELEEELPFNGEDTVFDGRIVKLLGNTSEVMAIAAPKEAIRSQVQLMGDSGVETHYLTPEGCALGNLVEDWQTPPLQYPEKLNEEEEPGPATTCEVLVHFGHQRTLIVFYDTIRVLEVRSILWGVDQLNKAVAETYGLSPSEAQRQVQTSAFVLLDQSGATHDQIAYSKLITKIISPVLRDIRLTILEFKATRNYDVRQVLLSGGASRIRNMTAYATQGIEIACNRFNPLVRHRISVNNQSDGLIANGTVALGLALEGLRKPKNPPLNLLRGEFARQSETSKLLWDKWGTTVKYVSMGMVALYLFSSFRDTYSMEMADAANEVMKAQGQAVAGLKGSKANEKNLKTFIKEKKKMAAEVKSLVGLTSMNSALEILKKVSDAIPARNVTNLEIATFEVNDSKVSIQGYVSNVSESSTLSQAFKNLSGSSKHRTFGANIPPKNGKMSFAIDFEMDRGITRGEK